MGKIAQSLLEGGVKLGVSSRGLGTLKGENVNEDYNLICIDIVGDPSAMNAYVDGIYENAEYIMDGNNIVESAVKELKKSLDANGTKKVYNDLMRFMKDIKKDNFEKIQDLIKRRYQLKELSFKSTKEILPYTDQMFDVFSKSHAALSSFVEINKKQREYFKKKFINFLNPEYVKFVTDKNDKLIGFAIVTPSYAKALQKMNGKLWPFGIFHLLKAKKHSKWVTFYLIGILPEYQNKGITAIIFNEYHKEFAKKGVTECFRGPELEDNIAIQQLWRNFNPKVFKKRCTFRKDIS